MAGAATWTVFQIWDEQMGNVHFEVLKIHFVQTDELMKWMNGDIASVVREQDRSSQSLLDQMVVFLWCGNLDIVLKFVFLMTPWKAHLSYSEVQASFTVGLDKSTAGLLHRCKRASSITSHKRSCVWSELRVVAAAWSLGDSPWSMLTSLL